MAIAAKKKTMHTQTTTAVNRSRALRLVRPPKLVPGLILAAGVVMVAALVANYANARLGFDGLLSYIMTAIVIGLLVGNLTTIPASFAPGISFCLTTLLRLGIILMGIRLSFFDAMRIGVWGMPIVIICIATGLVLTTYFTRLLRLPQRLGALMAVGTSICGATAIVAAAPAIGAEDREVAYAVANITVFGIVAMMLYPYLADLMFAGNAVMAGLFQGTAIHETAQVTGAALIYDQMFGTNAKPSAADIAIVTKLMRNTFIAAVIPLMAYVYGRSNGRNSGEAGVHIASWRLFPLFILGFVAMAIFRSVGDAGVQHGGSAFGVLSEAGWSRGITFVSNSAGYALAMAMAGVGLGTNLKTLKGLGIKPFYVGLFASLVVGAASALAVFLLGAYVRF